jgi:hypothetical protein
VCKRENKTKCIQKKKKRANQMVTLECGVAEKDSNVQERAREMDMRSSGVLSSSSSAFVGYTQRDFVAGGLDYSRFFCAVVNGPNIKERSLQLSKLNTQHTR